MSNINLRLYGEQVYGLSSSFLNKYLSPSLDKDNFIFMFKNGLLKYENINIKKEILLHPTTFMNKLILNYAEVNIPDENGSLNINIQGLNTTLLLTEISENVYQDIIISQKNSLKEKFINELFNKITKKKESSTFLEGMIKNIIKKIIDGIKVNIKDIELIIKYENFEFIAKIKNLDITIENKELSIDINDLSILYNNKNTSNKSITINVIDKANFNIKLIINEENEIPCQLKINTKNIKVNIRNDIVKDIFDIVDLFRDIKYNKYYYRYKKLINYHKPKSKKINDYYRLLWLYAIETVIKLRKIAFFEKFDIFELLNFTQKKLIENNNDNLILVSDINILKQTKKIVEQKILDSKDSIANKFFSFFSSAKTEEKSLTEEEKNLLDDAYKESNLEKYILNKKFKDNNNYEKTGRSNSNPGYAEPAYPPARCTARFSD